MNHCIDAVLLDVGGVIYLPEHARIVSALQHIGVNVESADLDRAHYAGVAGLADFTEGDRDIWLAYNRAYVRACGTPDELIEVAAETLLNEFTTGGLWTRVVPGAREALRDLAALDVKLAIVSNSDGSVEADLQEAAICQVGKGRGVPVGAVLDSSVVGVAKPDPRIFELALDRLDVVRRHAIHVGDTPAADVEGARAADIHPVLMDPYDFHVGLDVDRVTSLADLVEYVHARRPN